MDIILPRNKELCNNKSDRNKRAVAAHLEENEKRLTLSDHVGYNGAGRWPRWMIECSEPNAIYVRKAIDSNCSLCKC